MAEESKKTTSPPENPPAPQAPMQSPSTPPYGSKILLIPLIIAILVVLLGVGYLVGGAKLFSPKPPPSVFPQITPQFTPTPTPTPDLYTESSRSATADWKTYKYKNFSVRLSDRWTPQKPWGKIPGLIEGVSFSVEDDPYELSFQVSDGPYPLEEVISNSGDLKNITLDKQPAVRFVTIAGQAADIYELDVQSNYDGKRFNISISTSAASDENLTDEEFDQIRSKMDEEFNQILSTFRFLETTPAPSRPQVCAQVITPAKNPKTGECREFPTPCDVPEGWEKVGDCK